MFDPDDLPPPPTLAPETYARLQKTLADKGPQAAVDQLCADLRELGDFNALFYALLMKKRVQLGVSPFPTGAAADLPASTHADYEQAIREAGRLVGDEFLRQHDLRKAWFYFNMLGEPGPVREYLESFRPTDADDIQPLIEVGLYHGVHPQKGFDLVVERYGICNAITTYSGQDFSRNPDAKQHCIRALVRSLYGQLRERLKADVEARGGTVPDAQSVGEIVAAHPELFDEGAYHIDTSHLSSVCQFALELEPVPGAEARPRAVCVRREPERHLQVLVRPAVREHLRRLQGPARRARRRGRRGGPEALPRQDGPRGGRREHVPGRGVRQPAVQTRPQGGGASGGEEIPRRREPGRLSCPGVYELCQQVGDFAGLADAAGLAVTA